MKVGIMQPYFFPYIGYWQLMDVVDVYVVYDDVNYINRGWINRNKILINGQPEYFRLPLLGASQNKLINEINVNHDAKLLKKSIQTIENAYKKAPYFNIVYPLLEKILKCECEKVSDYILYSFEIICQYLRINTKLLLSSSLDKNNSLRGQDKILEICESLKCNTYYNAIGGKQLYDKESFQKRGMEIKFLNSDSVVYKQFGNDFHSNLSIIDVMMFNEVDVIRDMLEQYVLE